MPLRTASGRLEVTTPTAMYRILYLLQIRRKLRSSIRCPLDFLFMEVGLISIIDNCADDGDCSLELILITLGALSTHCTALSEISDRHRVVSYRQI